MTQATHRQASDPSAIYEPLVATSLCQHEIPEAELLTILEAARWATSS